VASCFLSIGRKVWDRFRTDQGERENLTPR
jgi:hypothetical protein